MNSFLHLLIDNLDLECWFKFFQLARMFRNQIPIIVNVKFICFEWVDIWCFAYLAIIFTFSSLQLKFFYIYLNIFYLSILFIHFLHQFIFFFLPLSLLLKLVLYCTNTDFNKKYQALFRTMVKHAQNTTTKKATKK